MRFVDPHFLWAYLVLLIPLLIHLFHFRRFRKVAFSDLSMLKQIQTRSKRRRNVRKWLIMLARMLALAALVTAFAQPYFPGDHARRHSGRTWLQLDNSFSMQWVGEEGPLLEQAKELARELIRASADHEQFRIHTNNGSTGGWLDQQEAIAQVDRIRIEPAPNTYEQILQDRAEKGTPDDRLVLLSDFQHPEPAAAAFLDSARNTYALALRPQLAQNLSIDSVWLLEPVIGPGQSLRLHYQLSNHGSQDVEAVSVRLLVGTQQRSAQSVDLPAGEQREFEISYSPETSGWEQARLELDDPVSAFDNTYYFDLQIARSQHVLIVAEQGSKLRRIFADDPTFDLQLKRPGELDRSMLEGQDLIVLDGIQALGSATVDQLREQVQRGSSLLYIPPVEEPGTLAEALGGWALGTAADKGVQVDPLSLNHPFYTGVFSSIPDRIDLPTVGKLYPSAMDGSSVIVRLKDGTSLFGLRQQSKGRYYQLQVPMDPEWSDLAGHELWVLTVLRALLSGKPVDELAYALDRTAPIDLPGRYREEALELSNGRSTLILDKGYDQGRLRCWLNPSVNEAGAYLLRYQGQAEILRPLSLNYSRRESVSSYLDAAALRRVFGPDVALKSAGDKQIALSIVRSTEGRPLWKHFVLLCLIFVLIEILLLRFSKS